MNFGELNLVEFISLLKDSNCEFDKVYPNSDSESTANSFPIKYLDKYFKVIYSLKEGVIKEARAVTEKQIYPDNSSKDLVQKLIDFCDDRNVSIISARIHDRSKFNEEYLKSIENKGKPAGSFASVDLLYNLKGSLRNLYDVVIKSYEIFGGGKND